MSVLILKFEKLCMHVQSLSRVQLFATLWTTACQAPLPIGFFRQAYWSISSSERSSRSRDKTSISCVSCVAGEFSTH